MLHRTPDSAGLDYWVSGLAHGGTRADILVSFAVSAEDVANTNAISGHGGGWLIDTGKGGYTDSTGAQHMAHGAEPALPAVLVGVAGHGDPVLL